MIIYKESKVVKCWSYNNKYYQQEIITYIAERKFLFWKTYEIRQIVPLLPKPFYDGEYASNEYVSMVAQQERGLAEIFLEEYECNNNK